MKTRSLAAAASIGFMFLLMLGINAEAAELKVLSAIGMQSVLEGLGPKFERATGHKLAISFATAGAAIKRAQGGEAVDVLIATRQGIDGLVKNGKAAADNVTTLASAGIDIVGPLPGDLQNIIVFAAAVMASAKDAEAAKALVTFLRTPEAVAVIRTKGMEPSTP